VTKDDDPLDKYDPGFRTRVVCLAREHMDDSGSVTAASGGGLTRFGGRIN
jgi:hypothetical protein